MSCLLFSMKESGTGGSVWRVRSCQASSFDKLEVKTDLIDTKTFILGHNFEISSKIHQIFLVLNLANCCWKLQRQPIPYRAYGIIELSSPLQHCELMWLQGGHLQKNNTLMWVCKFPKEERMITIIKEMWVWQVWLFASFKWASRNFSPRKGFQNEAGMGTRKHTDNHFHLYVLICSGV